MRSQEERGRTGSVRVEVRELTELTELKHCERIQRAVWNAAESELVGASLLRAAQHAGGLVAGAWVGGEMVGFTFGFPAHHVATDPPQGLHSHMTGVLASARSGGAGRALKWFQRRWCLQHGLRWVEWTFDPLRAPNARLNLEYLGATVSEYLVDVYGQMEDDLNRGMPSDRLVAHWDLQHPVVAALADDRDPLREPPIALPALESSANGGPGEPRLELAEAAISVEVPENIGQLGLREPGMALEWRYALRHTLLHYLGEGYRPTRFLEGAYILQRTSPKVHSR